VKTYAITIQPLSPFGTPLKGDTIFGQFCWECSSDSKLLQKPFEAIIKDYSQNPFAIFSSAYPKLPDGSYALKRPDAPLDMISDLGKLTKEELIDKRKELKSKKWVICKKPDMLKNLHKLEFINDDALAAKFGLNYDALWVRDVKQSHNSINRLTGTTGEGFAPFTQKSTIYAPGCTLVIFAAIDEKALSAESLRIAIERIAAFGFGRDASTGLGKFKLCEMTEIDLESLGSDSPNALYTLSPSVPDAELYEDAMFTPFTRFGRHGDKLATSGKPFKNPVIMIDEAALLFPKNMSEALKRGYLGKGVTGISKIQENAVHQGYSLYIPVKLEVK